MSVEKAGGDKSEVGYELTRRCSTDDRCHNRGLGRILGSLIKLGHDATTQRNTGKAGKMRMLGNEMACHGRGDHELGKRGREAVGQGRPWEHA
jgi:hypothetical protein